MRLQGFWSAWLAVALVASLPLLAHIARHREPLPVYSGEGFAAFYCAGEAVRARRDPYRTEPLRSCEARTGAVPAGVAEPAPLPPATLGAFALLAALPYRTATVVWLAILGISVVVTGLALVRLCPRVAPVAIWTSLLPGLVVLNGYYGETPPLVAGALALTGYALFLGATRSAVACVAVAAAFEPHVGGPAALALLAIPRARPLLALAGLAYLALSIGIVGFDAVVEYATRVLPAHAISELPAGDQYSLSSILFQLGTPARIATLAGNISYAVALVASLVAAPIAARTYRAPQLLAFVPAAAVLIGGPFLHDLQLSLALPLAVAVAAAVAGLRAARALAFATLLVGAIPQPASATTFLSFGAAAAFAAAWTLPAASGEAIWYRSRLAFGACGAVAYALVASVVHALGAVAVGRIAVPAGATAAAGPNEIAEVGWHAYVAATSGSPTAGSLLAKALADALLVTIFVLLATAWRAGLGSGSNSSGNSVA